MTKTKDLQHCEDKLIKDSGLVYTKKCVECQQVKANSFSVIRCITVYLPNNKITMCLYTQGKKNLRGVAAYNYILKPAATGALILEASVSELIQFSPFVERSGAAQMETT